LQNKALSSLVFALVGVLALALIIFVVMSLLRRQQRKKLLEDAVSFEPASSRMYLDEMDHEDQVWNEKHSRGYQSDAGQGYRSSGSMTAVPPSMYYEAAPPSQLAYDMHGTVVYNTPQPYDRMPSISSNRMSDASQSGLGQSKAQPALSATSEDNRSVTPEPISRPGPLKITNQ
jgi:hypothetical protein